MKLIIADQQEITRFALERLATERAGFRPEDVVRAAGMADVKEALARCGGEALAVVDYSTLNVTEEELTLLSIRHGGARFLLFSEQLGRELLRRLLLQGRQFSVVLKECPLREIAEALEEAARGRQYVCTEARRIMEQPERRDDRSPLTRTEREILRLLAMGKKSKQIAEERYLSVYTVMTHRKNIFRKLGVNNAQEAVRYALRAGIVDPLEYYI